MFHVRRGRRTPSVRVPVPVSLRDPDAGWAAVRLGRILAPLSSLGSTPVGARRGVRGEGDIRPTPVSQRADGMIARSFVILKEWSDRTSAGVTDEVPSADRTRWRRVLRSRGARPSWLHQPGWHPGGSAGQHPRGHRRVPGEPERASGADPPVHTRGDRRGIGGGAAGRLGTWGSQGVRQGGLRDRPSAWEPYHSKADGLSPPPTDRSGPQGAQEGDAAGAGPAVGPLGRGVRCLVVRGLQSGYQWRWAFGCKLFPWNMIGRV